MAKVALRIYNQEIESMVERGDLDEAIAHCRHVLNFFPKNLGTYRLIGKAYLESKRYKQATDIFERLLMAVPDDFVAHVGMSIINDEGQNMDAAIWHMERAFEVQPSNAAIQVELQRLYGRRDGVEPPKIRLTRGALAHMYVQGELYPQAISEINSVLEDDPKRQDMQALLARAYFHAGQKAEAADICSQLLRRYPYCFEANRVLVELLPPNESDEKAQSSRKRMNELDPYTAFATASVFLAEEVSDTAVSLEKLEWDGRPVDMQPEWSETLGIGKSDEKPDWLTSPPTEEAPTASAPAEEPAPAPGGLPIPTTDSDDTSASETEDSGSEEIPDFMREAGWEEGSGIEMESTSTIEASDESAAEPIPEGDLPPWVQDAAPAGVEQEDEPSQTDSTEDITKDDVPDWLQGVGDAQSPVAEDQLQSAEEGSQIVGENDLPDWLSSPPEAQESVEEPVQESPSAMDAMAESQEGGDQPQRLDASKQEGSTPPPEDPMAEPLPTPTSSADELGTTRKEQDDALAWLESLAAEQGAKPEELVTDPEARSETAPEWVQQAAGAESEEPVAEAPAQSDEFPATGEPDQTDQEPIAEEPALPVEAAPPPVQAVPGTDELGPTSEEQDDAVAWLEGLAEQQGAKPEELVTDPEARSEAAPDWVQQAGAAEEQTPQAEIPAAEESTESPVEEMATPPPAAVASTDELGGSAEEQDDAVAWLEGLAEQQGAKPEELVTDPAARSETAPDWVQKAVEAEGEESVGEERTPSDEIPSGGEPIQPPGEAAATPLAATTPFADFPGVTPGEPFQPDELPTEDEPDQPPADVIATPPVAAAPSADEPGAADEGPIKSEEFPAEGDATQPQEETVVTPPVAATAEPDELDFTAEAQDDAAAWLEGLAAQRDAKSEELEPDPGISQTAPDEVQLAAAEESAKPVTEEISPPEEHGVTIEEDWMKKAEEDEESLDTGSDGPQSTEPLPSGDDETGMWLRDLQDDQTSEPTSEEVVSQTPVGGTDELPAENIGVEDLPTWLEGLDEEEGQEETTPVDDSLPEWLSSELEQESGSLEPGQQAAEREEPVSEDTPPKPTSPQDWQPSDAAAEAESAQDTPAAPEPELAPESEPAPQREKGAVPEAKAEGSSGFTGKLSPTEDSILKEAQKELKRSDVPAAMENYGKLIKKGKLIDEVIFDLREALYRFPVDVSILQTLGDAYMRANRLQDALDAYTKAEELLR